MFSSIMLAFGDKGGSDGADAQRAFDTLHLLIMHKLRA